MTVQDGPAKEKRQGQGMEADADAAPASKAVSFGLPTIASSVPAPDGAKASSGFAMPSGTNAFGQSQHFSFGSAAALTGPGNKDAQEPQPGQDQAPAETASASAGFAALPSFLGAGGKPVEAASGGQLGPGSQAIHPWLWGRRAAQIWRKGAPSRMMASRRQTLLHPNGAAAGLPLSEVQHAVLLSSCLA